MEKFIQTYPNCPNWLNSLLKNVLNTMDSQVSPRPATCHHHPLPKKEKTMQCLSFDSNLFLPCNYVSKYLKSGLVEFKIIMIAKFFSPYFITGVHYPFNYSILDK
ncbi:hypothetical protein V8G54_022265 [Vigna mungo]|uniref:Uncharacterized protein n=1 Tax=Vigna mungo TaxID=3915 RepID=A0AAQ3RV12_VIGMU